MSSAYKQTCMARTHCISAQGFFHFIFHLMPVRGPAVPTSTCFWSAAHPSAARDPHLAALPVDVSSHKSRSDLLLVSSQPNPYPQSLADPNQSPTPSARSPSPAQIICSQASSPTSRHALASNFNHLFCRKVLIMKVSLCSESAENHTLSKVLRGFHSETANEYSIWGLQQIRGKQFFYEKEKRV